ncbi:MAG: hypothetical protein U0163_21670 [Gemmatimonadaceae bacterium]
MRIPLLLAVACLMSCRAAPDASTKAGDSSVVAGASATEQERLVAGGEAVRRQGDTLVLHLRAGGDVRLANDTAGSDNWLLYEFDRHLDRAPFYGVRLQFFEGQGYLLVHDSTGRQTRVDAQPVVSPDGHRVATASMDLVAAFDPTRLFVGAIVGDTMQTEFELEPTDWGPDSLAWSGADTVRFVQRWVTAEPGAYRDVRAKLVRSRSGWQLTPADTSH